MEKITTHQLKEAATFLRVYNMQEARSILIDLLKDDPDLEHAWYLLSLTTSDIERQKFALSQVLRINPENNKAMQKMNKLVADYRYETGPQVVEPPKNSPEPISIGEEELQAQEIPATDILPPPINAFTDDDLLSQRLFGGIDIDELEEFGTPESESEKPSVTKTSSVDGIGDYWNDDKTLGLSPQTWQYIAITLGVILIAIIVFILLKI